MTARHGQLDQPRGKQTLNSSKQDRKEKNAQKGIAYKKQTAWFFFYPSLNTLYKTALMKHKRFSVAFTSFQAVRTLATLWHPFSIMSFSCFFIQNQSRLARDKVTTIQKPCDVTHCIMLRFEQLNEKLF